MLERIKRPRRHFKLQACLDIKRSMFESRHRFVPRKIQIMPCRALSFHSPFVVNQLEASILSGQPRLSWPARAIPSDEERSFGRAKNSLPTCISSSSFQNHYPLRRNSYQNRFSAINRTEIPAAAPEINRLQSRCLIPNTLVSK